MISSLKRLPKNTLEILITLNWSEIKTSYDQVFQKLVLQVEVAGFRKGKAPIDIAQKKIEKTKVYEQVLKDMVPKIYQDAVKEQNINPVISPKIEVLEAEENKDWKLKITTCEKPVINLGNYQDAIAKLLASKKAKIWTPKDGQKTEDKDTGPTVSELLDTLAKEIKVEISDMILEQEVNRKLANLVDQVQKIGMTVEQYLQANNKTSDSIRQEYQDEVAKTLGLEFALEEISQKENVTVSEDEINEFISQAKTDDEKKSLESQKYYLATILRRQKTIKKLLTPTIIKP